MGLSCGKSGQTDNPTADAVPVLGNDGILSPELLGVPPLAVQLDTLSGILMGLSSTFYHLSDRTRKPGLFEVRQLCESISDRYCASCAHRALCWEEDFSSTADAMGRITLCIHRKGRAEALPDSCFLVFVEFVVVLFGHVSCRRSLIIIVFAGAVVEFR